MTGARRTRVLLYSATPRADRGGVQRMMDELETALPEHGIDLRRAGPDEDAETGGLTFAATTDAGSHGRPSAHALPAALGALRRLAGLLHRTRPDVVNMHFITGEAVYFLLLRRLFGYRVVLSGHGGDLLRPTPQMRRHLPRILRAADAVTVVSAELAHAARAHAGPGLHAPQEIANGVDAGFWCPAGAAPEGGLPEPDLIVAAGRLLPIKGFDLLIDAMAELPDARLRILGDGTEREPLQRRIDAAGLTQRVTLAGHRTALETRAEFRRAQIFAMPSRGEGMPLALLEALASGCPAVASDVGAIPEVLTEGAAGTIVPAGDVPALRRALSDGLSGKAGLSREAARSLGARFSRDTTYGLYAALLRDVAADGRRR